MAYHVPWLLAAALYAPIFFQLYQSRWETLDYTHAYFVLPVSLWLAWRKIRGSRNLSGGSDRRADMVHLTALAAGLLLFVFGWRRDFLVLASFSLIPVAWGVSGFLYGPSFVKALTFPILYLLFLVPPPMGVLDAVTMPMRYAISGATEMLLRMLDYPIQRSGLLMTIDGKEIFMGAPCSGFRSLITMFALASVYVYVSGGSPGKKAALLSSVIPLTLAGNLIRVVTLCLLTYYAGEEAARGFWHTFSGAAIFLLMTGCFMLLENGIERFRKGPRHAF